MSGRVSLLVIANATVASNVALDKNLSAMKVLVNQLEFKPTRCSYYKKILNLTAFFNTLQSSI